MNSFLASFQTNVTNRVLLLIVHFRTYLN